jgi:hypothetical protein
MPERRTKERRKNGRAFRVDVKRLEHQQLYSLVLELAEQVVQLRRDVDELQKTRTAGVDYHT